MSKFRVTSTQLTNVTWEYDIEADSADEALEKYWAGDHDDPIREPQIGDSIGDSSEAVEEVK